MFAQGQAGRASGGGEADYLRNVREHLGALSEMHVYKCFHTRKHLLRTGTQSLCLTLTHTFSCTYANVRHKNAQTLQRSEASSR